MPVVVTLANVDGDDLSDLKLFIWTDIAGDDEQGQRQERTLSLAQLIGRDLRCVIG